MALINERDIDAAREPPAMAAGEPHPVAPAQSGEARGLGETENQLLNLRTEIAKHAAATRKTVILAGLLVVLASVAGQWLLFKAVENAQGGGEPAAALHDEMRQALTAALQGEVARPGGDLKGEMKGATGQQRQSAMNPAQQTQLTQPDCRGLADVQTTAVDLSIRFELSSAAISPESASVLDSMAKILALAPTRCVLVEGYSDASGKDAKNLALSHERAVAVVEYLVGKGGLDRNMLVPLGKGAQSSGQAFAATDPRNRRVIFRVVADEQSVRR